MEVLETEIPYHHEFYKSAPEFEDRKKPVLLDFGFVFSKTPPEIFSNKPGLLMSKVRNAFQILDLMLFNFHVENLRKEIPDHELKLSLYRILKHIAPAAIYNDSIRLALNQINFENPFLKGYVRHVRRFMRDATLAIGDSAHLRFFTNWLFRSAYHYYKEKFDIDLWAFGIVDRSLEN